MSEDWGNQVRQEANKGTLQPPTPQPPTLNRDIAPYGLAYSLFRPPKLVSPCLLDWQGSGPLPDPLLPQCWPTEGLKGRFQ